MHSYQLVIPKAGRSVQFRLTGNNDTADIVILLPDEVQVAWPVERSTPRPDPILRGYDKSGFPSRILAEAVIIQTLREYGGRVRIRDAKAGWNIYDELAARLGVSVESRTRVIAGAGEPAWWTEVGMARQNLELRGVVRPISESGPEVWALASSVPTR
jgi:hypothetical protein